METIKQIALSVCITAVISSILFIIVPSGHFEKVLKLVVGIYIIYCIVTPILKLKSDFKIDTDNTSSGSSNTTNQEILDNSLNQLRDIIKTKMEKDLEQNLLQKGIKAKTVTININMDDPQNIKIDSIQVKLGGEARSQEVTIIVKEMFGITPTILK